MLAGFRTFGFAENEQYDGNMPTRLTKHCVKNNTLVTSRDYLNSVSSKKEALIS